VITSNWVAIPMDNPGLRKRLSAGGAPEYHTLWEGARGGGGDVGASGELCGVPGASWPPSSAARGGVQLSLLSRLQG
jgi:hypothetical protein